MTKCTNVGSLVSAVEFAWPSGDCGSAGPRCSAPRRSGGRSRSFLLPPFPAAADRAVPGRTCKHAFSIGDILAGRRWHFLLCTP